MIGEIRTVIAQLKNLERAFEDFMEKAEQLKKDNIELNNKLNEYVKPN